MHFTGDEYNYYINWVLHVILGRLGEADGFMMKYEDYSSEARCSLALVMERSLSRTQRTGEYRFSSIGINAS
jgi:hypothetical protein